MNKLVFFSSKHIKYIFIIVFINISYISNSSNIIFCSANNNSLYIWPKNTAIIPEISFKSSHIDLGKVTKGQEISFIYEFTNTGKVDISIDFVSGCDCTELNWPSRVFKPGESGKIDVIFYSAKKDKSETVEIDVLLKNVHPKTKNPIFEILTYSYEF